MRDKPNALIKKRKRLLKPFPSLEEVVRGTVFERTHKCGKSYCHCADGKGHPTFYLTVTFSSGKTEQISLPAELVPKVRQWVENYRKLKEVLEDIYAVNRKLIRVERERIRSSSKK